MNVATLFRMAKTSMFITVVILSVLLNVVLLSWTMLKHSGGIRITLTSKCVCVLGEGVYLRDFFHCHKMMLSCSFYRGVGRFNSAVRLLSFFAYF